MEKRKKRLFLSSPYPAEVDHLLLPIFDEAVRRGKSLGRPFEEREVLNQERADWPGLMLQMDPRFYAVQAATATQPRLWVVNEPVYMSQEALLNLPYHMYRCTCWVHAAKAVFGACLLTMDGLEEFVAGDYVYFDEQWRTWELRRLAGKIFLERYALQGPDELGGWFLYRHIHPYRVVHVETRFALHTGTKLLVSEWEGGYVRWNGKQAEEFSVTILNAFDLQRSYQFQTGEAETDHAP